VGGGGLAPRTVFIHQLLGRSLDLNRLLAQRMTDHTKKAIEIAIARFEGSEFTHIIVRHRTGR